MVCEGSRQRSTERERTGWVWDVRLNEETRRIAVGPDGSPWDPRERKGAR